MEEEYEERMVFRLGVIPIPLSLVNGTIESKLMIFAGNFPLKVYRSVEKTMRHSCNHFDHGL